MPQRLGQHFLYRETILEQLAAAACGEHTPRVIEIGPGLGTLTNHLLRRTDELYAIEIDSKLVEMLRRKYAGDSRVHVHEGDVLNTDLSAWGAAIITGNLPYYITSPIIEKFLRLPERFERAMFLMQWEVLQRLIAQPGTRAYGYLTFVTQIVCDLEVVAKVPPSAFRPPPKVMSGALRFTRKREQPGDLEALRSFASACFLHKRKTLRNNLQGRFRGAISGMPEAGLRAEQLSPEQIIDLYHRLSKAAREKQDSPVH